MLVDGYSMVHYGSIDFLFDGKEKAEKIEWAEKNINNEITKNLQHHLKSKAIALADVEHYQNIIGGNHRDVAFKFGVSIIVEIID
jgi:hypothetical protein